MNRRRDRQRPLVLLMTKAEISVEAIFHCTVQFRGLYLLPSTSPKPFPAALIKAFGRSGGENSFLSLH